MKKISKIILGTILLVFANILFITITWMKVQFGDVKFAEIVFQLMIPLKGSNMSVFQKFGIFCILVAIIIAIPGIILAIKEDIKLVSILHIRKKYIKGPLSLWRRFYPLITSCILISAIIYGMVSLGVPDYIKNNLQSSTIFEEYYVDPKAANITFPEKKRNLIYIFMESMEDSYMSRELGGAKPYNLIPELTELQLSNTNFSASGKISGGIAATGSTWTVGAIVAQTAGIPLSIPIDGNSMNKYNSFLPGAYSIGDILNSMGYQQVFLIGSDAVYGGRLNYMTQHGNYEVKDYNYATQKGWIDPDYHVFWGYEDQKLYSNAKEELTRLAKSDQPFNLTMLTVDTHYVGGYRCEQCGYEYGDQYSNVIACGSKQLVNFISWIKQQPFYENTTIVISGDHPTMDSKYMKDKPTGYQRKVYSTIINSAVKYTLDFDRNFTTMDMYPTTLVSLGVVIEGERLGLGTNLFSDTPTLLEEMGLTELNNQLKRNSLYYNEKLLYKLEY